MSMNRMIIVVIANDNQSITHNFDIIIQQIKDDVKKRPQWEQDYLRGKSQ